MGRVLAVDDEPQILAALQRVVVGNGDAFLGASTGLEAVELASTRAPDLVVLDLGLPDIDGVEVVRRIRGWSDVPILILSGIEDETRKVSSLDSGADDFLQKPFSVDELQARLRALRRRGPRQDTSQVLRFGRLTVDLPHRVAAVDGEERHLTPTEWQILDALVTRPGKLLTHAWLAGQVWGYGHGDDSRQALRTHIRSLRAKLGDDAQDPTYLRTEPAAGYRWVATQTVAETISADEQSPPPQPEAVPADLTGAVLQGTHDLNNALTQLSFSLAFAEQECATLGPGAGTVRSHLAAAGQALQRAVGCARTIEHTVDTAP